jgi:hypothetical protein
VYIWGARYIDDLVLRERGQEKLYSLADTNWNVVAIANGSGTIQDRMKYDGFGKVKYWKIMNFKELLVFLVSVGIGGSCAQYTATFVGQNVDSLSIVVICTILTFCFCFVLGAYFVVAAYKIAEKPFEHFCEFICPCPLDKYKEGERIEVPPSQRRVIKLMMSMSMWIGAAHRHRWRTVLLFRAEDGKRYMIMGRENNREGKPSMVTIPKDAIRLIAHTHDGRDSYDGFGSDNLSMQDIDVLQDRNARSCIITNHSEKAKIFSIPKIITPQQKPFIREVFINALLRSCDPDSFPIIQKKYYFSKVDNGLPRLFFVKILSLNDATGIYDDGETVCYELKCARCGKYTDKVDVLACEDAVNNGFHEISEEEFMRLVQEKFPGFSIQSFHAQQTLK